MKIEKNKMGLCFRNSPKSLPIPCAPSRNCDLAG